MWGSDLCAPCSLVAHGAGADACLRYGSLLEHLSIALEIVAGRNTSCWIFQPIYQSACHLYVQVEETLNHCLRLLCCS